MREREGRLFGNASGGETTCRSEMRLQIRGNNTRPANAAMLPHRKSPGYSGAQRNKALETPALTGSFDVCIQSPAPNHGMFVSLFVLTTLLYGFGRRSRKGMGTVQITGIGGEGRGISFAPDIDNILTLLNCVRGNGVTFALDGADIVSNAPSAGYRYANYPYIERIYLWRPAAAGVDVKNIIERIGLSAHEYSGEKFIGSARPRFASSLLLSTTPEPACIVTQLHCTESFDAGERDKFLNNLHGRI
jgi:hypothetical protein